MRYLSRFKNISNEAIEKLEQARPRTLGAAGRIEGVPPTALVELYVHLKKARSAAKE